jgi:outer membrane lipoprotein-sorting protein
MIKRTLMSLALIATAILSPVAAADPTPTAAAIVEAADRIRNPQQTFRVSLSLVEYVRGAQRDVTGLAVYVKRSEGNAQYKNLADYTAPPRDHGKLVLLSGGNMWFYDPASKASIRISPQQRLTGQASDGDVLTVNLGRDYSAKILGEEAVQDADRVARTAWHLDLTASTADAMYARMEYWVEKGTFRPIKARFYSDSGRALKIAYYRRYESQLGAERPTETIIIDAVDVSLVTKIEYSDFRAEDVPDAWFQRDFLPRFRDE